MLAPVRWALKQSRVVWFTRRWLIGSTPQSKRSKTNLALTKQPEHFTVLKQPVNKAIRQFAEAGQQFDLIMMDPPYAQQQVLAQLAAFISTNLLRPGARVLVETGMDVTYPDEIPGYIKLRRQTYGVAQVLILERSEENND